MPVSWQLCFLNLVTFVFLYVCTPSLWAVCIHSWPWHVWKAQTDFGFVYIYSWWLRLFIFDRNSTEIPFLSQSLLSRRYMMISCLTYSGVDCECFSGVWSPCSDCVHNLFCNKASAYFKINHDGIYLTCQLSRVILSNIIVCILLSERVCFSSVCICFFMFFISVWTLEFFFYSVYYISSWYLSV